MANETQTEHEAAIAAMRALKTYVTSVAAVRQVTPRVRRITFAGGDLESFRPIGPDQFLYLLLPPPGRADLTIDQSFSWETVREMPEADRPVGAYYTVRAFRPEAAELDIDVVVHDPIGHASGWARDARPGDRAALWGPRKAYDPKGTPDWYLLIADETAIPALAAILATLPASASVTAVVEVADAAEEQPLPTAAALDLRWVHRAGAEAGRGSGLVDAVSAFELPSGRGYAWGGGEVKAMNAARRHLRAAGLAREDVSVLGYWRHAAHEAEGFYDDDE